MGVQPAPPDGRVAPRPASIAERFEVQVAMAGPPADVQGVQLVLEAALASLDGSISFAEVAEVSAADVLTPSVATGSDTVRVWIDIGPARVTVYLVDRWWERILVRHVPLPGGVDEVAREQIALIVSASLEAMRRGARIGISRAEARQALGTKAGPGAVSTPSRGGARVRLESGRVEPDVPRPELWTWLAVGYQVLGVQVGASSVEHGPTLQLGAGVHRRRLRLGGEFFGKIQIPRRVAEPGLTVVLQGGGVRGLAVVGTLVGKRRATLLGAAGAGIDLIRVATRSDDGSYDVAPAQLDVVPIVVLEFRARGELAPTLALEGAVGLAIDLAGSRYVVDDGAGVRAVFDPWTARPGARLGILWDVVSVAAPAR